MDMQQLKLPDAKGPGAKKDILLDWMILDLKNFVRAQIEISLVSPLQWDTGVMFVVLIHLSIPVIIINGYHGQKIQGLSRKINEEINYQLQNYSKKLYIITTYYVDSAYTYKITNYVQY